jgi:hypothetical protein
MVMPVPTLDPNLRTLSRTLPADGYHPGETVWVHRSGSWRPGVVLYSSATAVTVRYRPGESYGTAVDTVTCFSLVGRDDDDPYLDQSTPDPLSLLMQR